MKLELKRMKEAPGEVGAFALHVDGKIMPAQTKTNVISQCGAITKVTVEFLSLPDDPNTVQIVGDDNEQG